MNEIRYYRLLEDVENPRPDRRSKTAEHAVLWPKGTLFRVTRDMDCPDYLVGRIDFIECGQAQCRHAWLPLSGDPRSEALLGALEEEAPLTLQILLNRYDACFGPSQWLAVLIEQGRVTLEDVEALARQMEEAPEGGEYDQMMKRQGVWR